MAGTGAEAVFLSSINAINENVNDHGDADVTSTQQIDSSDEYDPAQDMQDVSLSPDSQTLVNQARPLEESNSDSAHSRSMPALASPEALSNGREMNAANQTQTTDITAPRVETNLTPSTSTRTPPTTQPAEATNSEPSSNLVQNADVLEGIIDVNSIQANDITTNTTGGNLLAVPSMNGQATTITTKPRLPHDRIGILEDKIKEDEKGDLRAWLELIAELKKRGKNEEVRKAYERFLAVFPMAVEQWIAYNHYESESGNRAAVEAIFTRTLEKLPSLPFWVVYLDHIRRYYNISTDKGGSASQITHQAYEAVLKAVGIDKDSGKLWQDYIHFIRSGPGSLGGSNWQDQQKMDLLRKAYQRAIRIPTQAVEGLWRDYNAFEMGLNKVTGRKFIQDLSPEYMTARSSFTELQNITRDLNRYSLPRLPPAPDFDGNAEYMKQVGIWKRWIQWEKDDPLVLRGEANVEANAMYLNRILFVYKQALIPLQFWPEMWFHAAEFCFRNGLDSEGDDLLTGGISANPESCLLAFKLADRLEHSEHDGADDGSKQRRGAAVRAPYDKVLDALYELVSQTVAREARSIARIEAEFLENDHSTLNGSKDDDENTENDDDESPEKGLEYRKKIQINHVKAVNAVQIQTLHKTISHTWIALMRAIRRIQGKGKVGGAIGGSRQVFTDSRRRGRITSDVWIAAAMQEFHSCEGESAKRIFERGVKLFPEDETFALEYIKHLIATNDHTNARVVFETAVGRLSQKAETLSKAKPLYAFFHDFESRYGELSQIEKLEKRIRDYFPHDPTLSSFSRRFVHEGFDPTTVQLITSPNTQARPKMPPSAEPRSRSGSPSSGFGKTDNSPKRPLPFEDSEGETNRPRKIARGESPLKGAAGRRLDQQKRNRQPLESGKPEGHMNAHMIPPPSLPRDVLFLLSIIPKSSTYHATKFKPEEIVRLIRDTHIPASVNHLNPPPPSLFSMPMQQTPQGHYSNHHSFQR